MGTVAKALDLLDIFTRARPKAGLSEIARLAGVNKATCHRLLTEMESRGLVEQLGRTREYRLGPAVLRLAYLREASVPTRDAAMPVLQVLAQATGETAHLSYLVGGALSTLAFAYASRHGVRVTMEDADTLPFHATASGAAVLAWMPEADAERILSAPIPHIPPENPPEEVRARMAHARLKGWARTLSTFEKDVEGTAVPLFDAHGACIGALAVAAAAPRMTPELDARIVTELARAGAEINALWGGQIPPALETLWRSVA